MSISTANVYLHSDLFPCRADELRSDKMMSIMSSWTRSFSKHQSAPTSSASDISPNKAMVHESEDVVAILNDEKNARETVLPRRSPRKRKHDSSESQSFKQEKLTRVSFDALPVKRGEIPSRRDDTYETHMSPRKKLKDRETGKRSLRRHREDVTPFNGVGEGKVGLPPARKNSPAANTRSHDATKSKPIPNRQLTATSKQDKIGTKSTTNKSPSTTAEAEEERSQNGKERNNDRADNHEQLSRVKEHRNAQKPSEMKSVSKARRTSTDPHHPHGHLEEARGEPNTEDQVDETLLVGNAQSGRLDVEGEENDPAITILRGIENPAQMYGCQQVWTALLLAAKDMSHDAIDRKFKKASQFNSELRKVRAAYKSFRTTDNPSEVDVRTWQGAISNGLSILEELSSDLHAADPEEEDISEIRMVYQNAVLYTLQLLRSAIGARYNPEGHDQKALTELTRIINLVFRLLNEASRTKGGTKRLSSDFRKIRNELLIIKQTYDEIKYTFDHQILGTQRAEKIARRIQDRDDWRRQQQERNEKVIQEQRRMWISSILKANNREARRLLGKLGIQPEIQLSPPKKSHIFDIDDDLDINVQDDEHFENGTSTNGIHKSIASNETARPHLPRAPTEEIPGPTTADWTEEEDIALLNGLQTFTSDNRFEDILYSTYGDVINANEDRDVETLMKRAVYHKQTMATRLKGDDPPAGDWTWLLSIPG